MEFFLHPSIEMYVQKPNISHHKPIFDIKKNGTWYTPERLILGKKTQKVSSTSIDQLNFMKLLS